MAIRQYIGARYVTKIYENSLDPSSAEWEAGVTYEPLTLVTYLNSSYLSKKTVPGAIGNPAANPSYWAVTGAYNGQIVNLQNQIDRINNDNLNNIIGITDSYNNKYPDTSGNTMWEYFASYGNYSADKFRGYSYIGSGFISDTGNGTFYENIQTIASTLTADEKSAIGLILVAAGRNDWANSYLDILNAIKTFVTYCASEFPNAEVKLAYIANCNGDISTGTVVQNHNVFMAFKDCAWAGATFLNGPEGVLKDVSMMSSDWIHPSNSGRMYLAQALFNAIHNGSVAVNRDVILVNINYTHAGITSALLGAASIAESVNNDELFIRPSNDVGVLSFAYDTLMYTSGVFSVKIGELPHTTNGFLNYPLYDIELPMRKIAVSGWVDSVTPDTTLHDCGGRVTVNSAGEVILHLYAPALTNFKISNVYFLEMSEKCVPIAIC